MASGTSWQPDDTPMFGHMRRSGRWTLMAHFNAFLSYDHQGEPRGGNQVNSTNWFMLMGSRPVSRDQLVLRAMLSLEPITTTPRGYPLLFQSGEQYHNEPLVDRQHPHDLFMELAAKYTHPLSATSAVYLYAAPSGEPALGPPAFPHRLSAMDNPAAPIGHHWQDSTHIDFGVLTLGGWSGRAQLEGSYFTGREPDEFRYDLAPMHMDSFSGRLTYNPSARWSCQVSYGYLHSPEALRPTEDVRRTTASALYTVPAGKSGFWSSALVWGLNSSNGRDSNAYLLESDFKPDSENTFFGRVEYVDKLGEELNLQPMQRKFGIGQFTIGYLRELSPRAPVSAAIGGAITFSSYPGDLTPLYGRSPVSYWLFLRFRPAVMNMRSGSGSGMGSMGGMAMPH
ncbi:MAG TPA: hypothetical protein VGS41_12285 [Chthonomonadales bacterium]|nr:hypothetical protein [Chthonomonadales bacterium]